MSTRNTLSRPVALITGIAEGVGASLAKTFAAAGYDVVGLARSPRAAARIAQVVGENGGEYFHLCCDITQPTAVAHALGPYAERVSVFMHNANTLLIQPFAETELDEFEQAWRVACMGAFVVTRIVLPHMLAQGSGSIMFTGATASVRGGARFAAFSSAKFALRGLAQSLAREYSPQGVHVSHIVLDGLIDEPQTEHRFGSSENMRMDPDAIARVYLDLTLQPRSVWTHEIDLRPFSERF